jgi:DNA-binding NarL/FixJ family response regulator
MSITVTIVEDDEEIRHSLAQMVDEAPGLRCLDHYGTAEEALIGIQKTPPEVVLMDIGLPRASGVECVRRLKVTCPQVQFLMHTVYDDSEQIFQALQAGAGGYILKRAAKEELLAAIRDLYQGGSPMTSAIARKVVQYFHRTAARGSVELLSSREHEVLRLLATGAMYKEIADRLGISLDTVRKHIKNIYGKLHVHSRTEAALKYVDQLKSPR